MLFRSVHAVGSTRVDARGVMTIPATRSTLRRPASRLVNLVHAADVDVPWRLWILFSTSPTSPRCAQTMRQRPRGKPHRPSPCAACPPTSRPSAKCPRCSRRTNRPDAQDAALTGLRVGASKLTRAWRSTSDLSGYLDGASRPSELPLPRREAAAPHATRVQAFHIGAGEAT